MPKYKYIGKLPFVNLDFKINVIPNEVFVTEFVLPGWRDFVLLESYNTDVVSKTMTLNIHDTTKVDIGSYSRLKIILINNDVSVLGISVLDGSNIQVKLDDKESYYIIDDNFNLQQYKFIYLIPVNGVPNIKLFFNF